MGTMMIIKAIKLPSELSTYYLTLLCVHEQWLSKVSTCAIADCIVVCIINLSKTENGMLVKNKL